MQTAESQQSNSSETLRQSLKDLTFRFVIQNSDEHLRSEDRGKQIKEELERASADVLTSQRERDQAELHLNTIRNYSQLLEERATTCSNNSRQNLQRANERLQRALENQRWHRTELNKQTNHLIQSHTIVRQAIQLQSLTFSPLDPPPSYDTLSHTPSQYTSTTGAHSRRSQPDSERAQTSDENTTRTKD